MKKRGLLALLLAFTILFDGSIGLMVSANEQVAYVEEQSIQEEYPLEPETVREENSVIDAEDYSTTDWEDSEDSNSDLIESDDLKEIAEEIQEEATLPDEEDSTYHPGPIESAAVESDAQLIVDGIFLDGTYLFVVVDPDTREYRDMGTLHLQPGEQVSYELYFARIVNGEVKIIDYPEYHEITGNDEQQLWLDVKGDGSPWTLHANPLSASQYWAEVSFYHPASGNLISRKFWMYVEDPQNEYAMVIVDPETGEYRQWDNPTVPVGKQITYDLYFAKIVDGAFEIQSFSYINTPVGSSEQFQGTISSGKKPASLTINAITPGSYFLQYNGRHAVTVEPVHFELWLHVADDYSFVVAESSDDFYSSWDNPTVLVGTQSEYTLAFSRLVESGRELLDFPHATFSFSCDDEQQFGIFEEAGQYTLLVNAIQAGAYSITLRAQHPETGELVEWSLWLYVETAEYVFTFLDPDTNAYFLWDDPTVRMRQSTQYTVEFATLEDGQFQIQPFPHTSFSYESDDDDQFYILEKFGRYDLHINPQEPGSYSLSIKIEHPQSGKELNWTLWLHVAEASEYAFVVWDTITGEYRLWDDPTVSVEEQSEYSLAFARIEDGELHIQPYPEDIYWKSDDKKQFYVQEEDGQYALSINATASGSYCLYIRAVHPETLDEEKWGFWLHVKPDIYTFVIEAPDTGEYRLWDDPTIFVSDQQIQYYVHYARMGESGLEIVDYPSNAYFHYQNPNVFLSTRVDGKPALVINPSDTGTYFAAFGAFLPDGEEICLEMKITIQYEYLFMVADELGGTYREWDNPTLPVGTKARYALNILRREADGSLQLLEDAQYHPGWPVYDTPQIYYEKEGDQYYLVIDATEPADQYVHASFNRPENLSLISESFWVHIVENTGGLTFTVIDPGNNSYRVGPNDPTPVLARYKNSGLDPAQTLQVFARRDGAPVSPDEWTLTDPEGSLRFVSSDGDIAVYEMVHLTNDIPCRFEAENTVLNLKILPDSNYRIKFMSYDETLAPQEMEIISELYILPGGEVQIALCSFNYIQHQIANLTLIDNPLEKIVVEGPASLSHKPEDDYITLTAENTGQATLRVGQVAELNILISANGGDAWISFCTYTGKNDRNIILGGDFRNSQFYANLRGTVRCEVTSTGGLPSENLASLVRSSNPEIVEIEIDPQYSNRFYCKPTGFGTATIYLQSDELYAQMELQVFNEDVPLEASFDYSTANLEVDIPVGRALLPSIDFSGTAEDPFILPCPTKVGLSGDGMVYWYGERATKDDHFSSSNPDIVEIIRLEGDYIYLMPKKSGTCTIAYQDGPLLREVVVRSEPGALQEVGFLAPGFYTYYGSAQLRQEGLSLQMGGLITMGIASVNRAQSLEELELSRFRFSNPGVAQVTLVGDNLFTLVPTGQGSTTITYSTESAGDFSLEVTVGDSPTEFQFVTEDQSTATGYRLWGAEQVMIGDTLEREVFFARVAANGEDIFSLELLPTPDVLTVTADDRSQFNLVKRDGRLYATAAPASEGDYFLDISATPLGADGLQHWKIRMSTSLVITVTEPSVQAINLAIAEAPVQEGRETVILLPTGYIPMDYTVPVLLNRPVTLRGQNTLLNSDIAALCHTKGAKLQDIAIWFDASSRYSFISRSHFSASSTWGGIFGDGQITLENCTLTGPGTRLVENGISISGNRIFFQGENTVQNFLTGWLIESRPGPRLYARGITFRDITKNEGLGNGAAVYVVEKGSVDPYFIRLTECNFVDNETNIYSPFPVNFSHNYYQGGQDGENIAKWPQYISFLDTSVEDSYPALYIEEERLAFGELINFEGRAPINTENFAASGGQVKIEVKELLNAYVTEEEHSQVLLRWQFSGEQGQSPLFLPSAETNGMFTLPSSSGIVQYQGISFSHHGLLPLVGADISVRKQVFFEEDVLYLYKLVEGELIPYGEIVNSAGEFYTFFLDSCSDYIITNVLVTPGGEDSGGEGPNGENPGGESPGSEDSGDEKPGKPSPGNSGNVDRKSSHDSGSNKSAAEELTKAMPKTESQANRVSSSSQASSPAADIKSSNRTSNNRDSTIDESDTFPVASLDASISASLYGNIQSPDIHPLPLYTANNYLDDAAIRQAFSNSEDGQVILDVSVKTVVSGLALQLLQEYPSLKLILKGDGYAWTFSGSNISWNPDLIFDTTVFWQQQSSGYFFLSFAESMFPNGAILELEYQQDSTSMEWLLYHPGNQYIPCEMNFHRSETGLILQVETPGDYVLVYPD